MSDQYAIGLDYGTLSARAVLINLQSGETVAQSVKAYSHGVLENALLDGTPLGKDWALALPSDYLEALTETVPTLLAQSGVEPKRIVGIGLDVTASTFLPVDRDGVPLCEKTPYVSHPHAYMKMWKHHAAQGQARRMTALARQRGEGFLDWYGGTINAEWTMPKILQIAEEDPWLYGEAYCFMEVADWLVLQLTGEWTRSRNIAGYKLQYRKPENHCLPPHLCNQGRNGERREGDWHEGTRRGEDRHEGDWRGSDRHEGVRHEGNQSEGNSLGPGGRPRQEGWLGQDYLMCLDPLLENVVADKLGGRLTELGEKVGGLTPVMARLLGLLPETPVATAIIDAHVAVPAAGICRPGELLLVLGTSGCVLLNSEREVAVPGICGIVKDGILPGYYGYEAGQSSVGDTFDWFVRNCVPADYGVSAAQNGMDPQRYLSLQAQKLRVGESGLMALNWWNGSRSCPVDAKLKGMILGLDLATRPEHIYRALIEASAYGMRRIVETFEENGIEIRRVCACGGIVKKNPLLMQIYSDVLNREISIGKSEQGCALGAAMFGAVAGGYFPSILDAAAALGQTEPYSYEPVSENAAAYDLLYRDYVVLHDYFSRETRT